MHTFTAKTRCPWCRELQLQGGECEACGFTGSCPYCEYDVTPDNPNPQNHDGPCAAEAVAEARADEVT